MYLLFLSCTDPTRHACTDHPLRAAPLPLSSRLVSRLFSLLLVLQVPQDSLEFVIRCAGGRCVRESLGVVTSDAELATVTHHVVDRSAVATAGAQRLQRAFVQPQWVYDSFNMRALLPVAPYAPVLHSQSLGFFLEPKDFFRENFVTQYFLMQNFFTLFYYFCFVLVEEFLQSHLMRKNKGITLKGIYTMPVWTAP